MVTSCQQSFKSLVSSVKFCFTFIPNVLDSRSFSDIADLSRNETDFPFLTSTATPEI